MVGPGSSENNAIAVYDGASGKLLKDSGVTIAGGVLAAWSGVLSTGYGAESGSNAAYYNASGIVYSISGQGFQLSPHLSTESWTLTFPENNGENGQALVTDGSGNTSWSTIGGAGTVSSVSVSGSDGIEVDSGSPVTSSGTIALGINASTLASHLGLASTYQPLDAQLTDISALAPTKGKLIVGDGSNWVDLGVGSDDQVLTADSAEDNGVKWAASSGGGMSFDVQTFTATGTWTKPEGAVRCRVVLIGGGGGGGSGRRGAASTSRYSGGGGGGAGYILMNLSAEDLSSIEAVIIGAGGTGGNVITEDDTSGSDGGDGGISQFGPIKAVGGNGGKGGTASAAAGGTVTNVAVGGPTDVLNATMAGGAGSATNGAVGVANNNVIRPTGGGGGSGINSSNTTGVATGSGGVINGTGFLITTPINGGSPGGSIGADGADGNTSPFRVGTGGGGGRSGDTSGTIAAGAGGDGGLYGAGGGGGGASTNGANSGAGGNGGTGYVRIETLIQN